MTTTTTSPRLAPGTLIRVNDEWPEEFERVHVRTPAYVRGHRGKVVRFLGRYHNPEDLAFGRPAMLMELYHVEFAMAEIWSDPGTKGDAIVVELYEHWLTVEEDRAYG